MLEIRPLLHVCVHDEKKITTLNGGESFIKVKNCRSSNAPAFSI